MSGRRGASRQQCIRREATESGFEYTRNGKKITSRRELARIEALVIPPAWTDVEIAANSRAKVLALGTDAAGRVQRLYRPSFRQQQDLLKYERIVRFGKALPNLRRRVDKDLRRRTFNRDKAVACVVRLIDLELMRVGNSQYAKTNSSYGITTLRRKHLQVGGTQFTMEFVGKSGKLQQYTVRDRQLTKLIRELREMPGHEVFRYLDEQGCFHNVQSSHVNDYLRAHLGEEFTAKDFRTWGGSVTALAELLATDLSEHADVDQVVRAVIASVAERLGNTPAVTKSSYIDPRIFAAVDQGIIESLRRGRSRLKTRPYLSRDEQSFLNLCRRVPLE